MTQDTATETTQVAILPAAEPITLDYPIQRGNQRINQIHLRKPKSGALRGLSITALAQMDAESIATLVPRISTPTLTKADMHQMDPADLTQCGMAITNFLLPTSLKEPASPTE
ncbi:hypothetical protein GCM10007907_20640 [Chitinimonas prasina]|uniref:Phage tail assembly protein n=1 Tax=Chitinimonas prasina TaxID=1434937 RepID=A0ABQ5YK02_9NEIS|nr:phage tail assembly protein [Chitinimonas prasina]GLR13274.1 hypothetical protein GCM10007907_20640 [Chitinimonas prasina]